MRPTASPTSSSTIDISLDSSQFYLKYQGCFHTSIVSARPPAWVSSLPLLGLSPISLREVCPPGVSQPAPRGALLGPVTPTASFTRAACGPAGCACLSPPQSTASCEHQPRLSVPALTPSPMLPN